MGMNIRNYNLHRERSPPDRLSQKINTHVAFPRPHHTADLAASPHPQDELEEVGQEVADWVHGAGAAAFQRGYLEEADQERQSGKDVAEEEGAGRLLDESLA